LSTYLPECFCLCACSGDFFYDFAVCSLYQLLLVMFQFVSEAEQLAWAKRDSNQEWERLKKLQEQEQAELELALALSSHNKY
jgi:hypothetical protein